MKSETQRNIRKMEETLKKIKSKEICDIFRFEYVPGVGIMPTMLINKDDKSKES